MIKGKPQQLRMSKMILWPFFFTPSLELSWGLVKPGVYKTDLPSCTLLWNGRGGEGRKEEKSGI